MKNIFSLAPSTFLKTSSDDFTIFLNNLSHFSQEFSGMLDEYASDRCFGCMAEIGYRKAYGWRNDVEDGIWSQVLPKLVVVECMSIEHCSFIPYHSILRFRIAIFDKG